MNAPSSARSSKRSLRGRDTRQGTQFGRRGVGTGLGVSSAGDTNSWLWPASRASKSSKAIGPTGLFEGGAALKPARARAAMPKRGWSPGLPSEPAPKSAAFRVDDARAARDGAWRSQTTASWQPRRSRAGLEARRGPLLDATPTCRFAAEGSLCGEADAETSLARGSALHIVLGGCPHRAAPDECARDPGRRTAAPRRAGPFWQAGERSNFVRLGGFLPSAGGERRSDKGLPKTATPAPAARSQRGGTRFFAARETQGSEERAGSAAEALQGSHRLAEAGFRACARCAGEDRLLSSAPHGLKRPKSEAYIPEE